MSVLDDIRVLVGSPGESRRFGRGRRMKDDGLTFFFFRKLQSAGVSPTSSKSLVLNDTFNNFSLPCL